jgi:hypothetical protein
VEDNDAHWEQHVHGDDESAYAVRVERAFTCSWIGLALVPNEHGVGQQVRLSVENSTATQSSAGPAINTCFPEFTASALQLRIGFPSGPSGLAKHIVEGVSADQRRLTRLSEASLMAMFEQSHRKGSSLPCAAPQLAALEAPRRGGRGREVDQPCMLHPQY